MCRVVLFIRLEVIIFSPVGPLMECRRPRRWKASPLEFNHFLREAALPLRLSFLEELHSTLVCNGFVFPFDVHYISCSSKQQSFHFVFYKPPFRDDSILNLLMNQKEASIIICELLIDQLTSSRCLFFIENPSDALRLVSASISGRNHFHFRHWSWKEFTEDHGREWY